MTVVQTARKFTRCMVTAPLFRDLSSSRGSHIILLLFPWSGQSKHALFLSYALVWPLLSPLHQACKSWIAEHAGKSVTQLAESCPFTSDLWMPLNTWTALYKQHSHFSFLLLRDCSCHEQQFTVMSSCSNSLHYELPSDKLQKATVHETEPSGISFLAWVCLPWTGCVSSQNIVFRTFLC